MGGDSLVFGQRIIHAVCQRGHTAVHVIDQFTGICQRQVRCVEYLWNFRGLKDLLKGFDGAYKPFHGLFNREILECVEYGLKCRRNGRDFVIFTVEPNQFHGGIRKIIQLNDELPGDQAAHGQLGPQTPFDEQRYHLVDGYAFAFDQTDFVRLGFDDDRDIKNQGFGVVLKVDAFYRADFHPAHKHRRPHAEPFDGALEKEDKVLCLFHELSTAEHHEPGHNENHRTHHKCADQGFACISVHRLWVS